MSRASTPSDPPAHRPGAGARLRGAFTLWSVRVLAAVFLAGTGAALLSLAEGRLLREDLVRLEEARSFEERLDAAAGAVAALERRLVRAGRGEGEPGGFAAETVALRVRLGALAGAAGSGGPAPDAGILEALRRIEGLGERTREGAGAAAEAAALATALGEGWERFHRSVHEATERAAAVRALAIQERSAGLRWVLLFVGLGAAAALGAAVWAAGGGVLAARDQLGALAAQDYERAAEGGLLPGDLREQRFAVAAVASALAVEARHREAERARVERFARRTAETLEALAAGELERSPPAAEEAAFAPATAALERLARGLRARREEEREERARSAGLETLPREELLLLEGLLDLDPARQERAVAEFGPASALGGVARRVAGLAARGRAAEEALRGRAGRVLEQARALAGAVREREGEFRRESRLIHETSTTVNEVSVAAKQTAQMVEFVFRSSQEAMRAAEDGRELVGLTIGGMGTISARVGRVAEQILQLQARSQEIGAIVRAIGDLAKQTNLLALSAAIEAAGAGEHGRGFAVVAKEIRELAVRSARSTQDIQRIILEIQAATNSAVLSTEEGSKSVQEGVGHAERLQEAFRQIVARFQEVVESAQQISTAAGEQTAGARQVAGSIATIDRMVRATVEDLHGMGEMLEEYQAVARELAETIGAAPGAGDA